MVSPISFLHVLLQTTMPTNHLFLISSSSPLRFTLILFILVFAASIPAARCEDDASYTECNQIFDCGLLKNISYPFWGLPNRPQHCGRHGFELLNCEDESRYPHIKYQELDFLVLGINSREFYHTLNMSRADLYDRPCTENLVNTTLDYSRLSYVQTMRNLTLYYGCTRPNDGAYSAPNNFTCKIDSSSRDISYYVDDSIARIANSSLLAECFTNIRVPIFWEGSSDVPEKAMQDEVEKALRLGFQVEFMADWELCRSCRASNGTCGSTALNSTADSFTSLCGDGPHPLTCPRVRGSWVNWRRRVIVGVLTAGGAFLICAIIGLGIIKHKTYWANNGEDVGAFIEKIGPLAVKRYKFSDIRKMTNSFKEKLGEGGYGDVYKGKLSNGCHVAVKVLKPSKGNGEDFVNEVASISRTSHVNVVTLLGYCLEGRKKALIYEFMPNGSLEKFICKESSNHLKTTPRLELEKLFQIAWGIARGLEYLDRGCNTRILHFDIKPHNILLDANFCPKISDFGLSKLYPRKESIISMMEARGTIGYIAPEVFCRNFGVVSAKSDVYSYGMMILEMVGGRKNVDPRVSHTSEIYFPDWVYKHLEQSSNFGLPNGVTEEEKELARKMILVGLWCIQTKPSDRPWMSKVIEMLEGSIEAIQIPPRPVLSSPAVRSLPESSTIAIRS